MTPHLEIPWPSVACGALVALPLFAQQPQPTTDPCGTANPGTIERISLSDRGTETMTCQGSAANCKNNSHPSISGDGMLVAYDSDAHEVVRWAPNHAHVRQIYVRDLTRNTTRLVSYSSPSNAETRVIGNGHSQFAAMSGSGRYVAFTSNATNLAVGDDNAASDVFRHDLESGETILVTRTSLGRSGNAASGDARLSWVGNTAAFWSAATDLSPLVPHACGMKPTSIRNIYVRDLESGDYEWINHSELCLQPDGISYQPSISGNGTQVAFVSQASNLVANDLNGKVADVFLRDRRTGALVPISVDINHKLAANGFSEKPSVAAWGRYVAYESDASNLVPGDTNGFVDVFVRDVVLQRTTRISVSASGVEANGHSTYPAISADGRFVAFSSLATNLVGNDDTQGYLDFFVHDRDADADGVFDEPGGICTRRLSESATGLGSNGISGGNSSISDDGHSIPFMSHGSNLVPFDMNGPLGESSGCGVQCPYGRDIFIRRF